MALISLACERLIRRNRSTQNLHVEITSSCSNLITEHTPGARIWGESQIAEPRWLLHHRVGVALSAFFFISHIDHDGDKTHRGNPSSASVITETVVRLTCLQAEDNDGRLHTDYGACVSTMSCRISET